MNFFLRILFLVFAFSQVNAQVVCCYWLCFHPQAPPEDVSDNIASNVEASTEPVLQNIFYAPEICPKGFMPIQGKCRQIYSQNY